MGFAPAQAASLFTSLQAKTKALPPAPQTRGTRAAWSDLITGSSFPSAGQEQVRIKQPKNHVQHDSPTLVPKLWFQFYFLRIGCYSPSVSSGSVSLSLEIQAGISVPRAPQPWAQPCSKVRVCLDLLLGKFSQGFARNPSENGKLPLKSSYNNHGGLNL